MSPMQDLLHDVLTGLASARLVTDSARGLLATTAVFAGSRRRREAALRALRALNGERGPADERRYP